MSSLHGQAAEASSFQTETDLLTADWSRAPVGWQLPLQMTDGNGPQHEPQAGPEPGKVGRTELDREKWGGERAGGRERGM